MGAHKAHQTDAPNAFANKREKVHSAQSVCLPARQCWWEACVGRGRGAHNCEKGGCFAGIRNRSWLISAATARSSNWQNGRGLPN